MKMKRRVFYNENRLKAIATEVSAWPLTTSAERSDKEEKRLPTAEEKRIVFNIVYSALICFNSYCSDYMGGNNSEKEQAVCDNAEFTFDMFTNWQYNGYISLYCKLKDILRNWEMEEY